MGELQGADLTKVSTEFFQAKSRAELAKLAPQSGASIEGKSRGLCQENRTAGQEGTRKACTTRKLSVMLNYILDLSDYTGKNDVLSNTYMV